MSIRPDQNRRPITEVLADGLAKQTGATIDPKDAKPGEVYELTCYESRWVGSRNNPGNLRPWQFVNPNAAGGLYAYDADVSDLVRLVPARPVTRDDLPSVAEAQGALMKRGVFLDPEESGEALDAVVDHLNANGGVPAVSGKSRCEDAAQSAAEVDRLTRERDSWEWTAKVSVGEINELREERDEARAEVERLTRSRDKWKAHAERIEDERNKWQQSTFDTEAMVESAREESRAEIDRLKSAWRKDFEAANDRAEKADSARVDWMNKWKAVEARAEKAEAEATRFKRELSDSIEVSSKQYDELKTERDEARRALVEKEDEAIRECHRAYRERDALQARLDARPTLDREAVRAAHKKWLYEPSTGSIEGDNERLIDIMTALAPAAPSWLGDVPDKPETVKESGGIWKIDGCLYSALWSSEEFRRDGYRRIALADAIDAEEAQRTAEQERNDDEQGKRTLKQVAEELAEAIADSDAENGFDSAAGYPQDLAAYLVNLGWTQDNSRASIRAGWTKEDQ